MAQNGVPKFGNWDKDDNVPYTQYFEGARKRRGGGNLINPNDPLENPEAFLKDLSPFHASRFRTGTDLVPQESKAKLQGGREDGNFRRRAEPPLNQDVKTRKFTQDLDDHCNGDQDTIPHRKSDRIGRKSNCSPEQKPYYPAMISGKEVTAPTWQKKVSTERSNEFSPHSQGKSTAKPSVQREKMAEKGASVPKFGERDKPKYASAVSNKVRKEKHKRPAKVGTTSNGPKTKSNSQNSHTASRISSWCFSSCKC